MKYKKNAGRSSTNEESKEILNATPKNVKNQKANREEEKAQRTINRLIPSSFYDTDALRMYVSSSSPSCGLSNSNRRRIVSIHRSSHLKKGKKNQGWQQNETMTREEEEEEKEEKKEEETRTKLQLTKTRRKHVKHERSNRKTPIHLEKIDCISTEKRDTVRSPAGPLIQIHKKRNMTIETDTAHVPKVNTKKITAVVTTNVTSDNIAVPNRIDGPSLDRLSKKITKKFSKHWWVFLMVNLSPKSSRCTQIYVDKQPELRMLRCNLGKNPDHNAWVILMRIGGFDKKNKALEFYGYWNKKSRGLFSRIAKGISLVKKYHKQEKIILWSTTRSKREMIDFYKTHQKNQNNVDTSTPIYNQVVENRLKKFFIRLRAISIETDSALLRLKSTSLIPHSTPPVIISTEESNSIPQEKSSFLCIKGGNEVHKLTNENTNERENRKDVELSPSSS